MREGRLTCRGLVDAYIRRINAYDKNGPAINAIVTINPDATKEADEMDRRFAQSGLTGPLHCVPMIVKDNFETKGLQTSNGALVFAGYRPKEDASQVARVKSGGRDRAGEIQHGRVGLQSRRDGQFDSARLHEESLRAGSGDGGVERRHGGIDRGQLRAGRIRQRYRQLDSRAVIPSVSRGHPFHHGAHQPRRRVSSEPESRCCGTDRPHPGRRCQGVSGDRGRGPKRPGDRRGEGTRHPRLQQVAGPERPERGGHRRVA